MEENVSMNGSSTPLRVRWLGTVPYSEALAVQESMFRHGNGRSLLLMEHPHVFTYGPSAELDKNLKCDPAAVGADFVKVKRGGDITYHGPGQLVGYPVLSLSPKHGGDGPADSVAYVRSVEQVIINALREIGLSSADRFDGYPGVWVDVNGSCPAQDLCDRRACRPSSHHARFRGERVDRSRLHDHQHRSVRHLGVSRHFVACRGIRHLDG